jgi:hypothetical protein
LFLALLAAVPAQADYYAKINDIAVSNDGLSEVFVTVLDGFGQSPAIAEYETIQLSFGEANRFRQDDGLEAVPFSEAGLATDYVMILPGYRDFGQQCHRRGPGRRLVQEPPRS